MLRVMHVNDMRGGYKGISSGSGLHGSGLGIVSAFPDYVSLTPASDAITQQLSDNAVVLQTQYDNYLAKNPSLIPGSWGSSLALIPTSIWLGIGVVLVIGVFGIKGGKH